MSSGGSPFEGDVIDGDIAYNGHEINDATNFLEVTDLGQLNNALTDAMMDVSLPGRCQQVIVEVDGQAKDALQGLCVTFLPDVDFAFNHIYFKVTVQGITVHSEGDFTIQIDEDDGIETRMVIDALCQAGQACDLGQTTEPGSSIMLNDFRVKFEGLQSAGLEELTGGQVAIMIVNGGENSAIEIYRNGEKIGRINSDEVAKLDLSAARVEVAKKAAATFSVDDLSDLDSPNEAAPKMSSYHSAPSKKYGCDAGAQNLDFGSSWSLILLAIMVIIARRAQMSQNQLTRFTGNIIRSMASRANDVIDEDAEDEI